jgi:uncharacterized protein involved in response to NO
LFPLGAFLAWAAVLPWVLFGTGFIRAWLGSYHALTMTQGFLVAMAFGFLGTMLPRRTGAAPLTTVELSVAIGALIAVPICLLADWLIGAQLAYLMVLGTLVEFALRRLRRAGRPPHPSFVFLPLGLVGGMVGSILIVVSALGRPALLGPGRALVEEGLLLSLVLAMGPMLTSIITQGKPLADPPERRYRRQRALHLLAGALLFASFAVQFAVWERGGLLLRGIVLAVEVLLGSRIYRAPSVAGLHRRLYRLALALVPLGVLAAGARPAYRIPSLHLTFVGGLSLLVFAVSFHVVFLHTGRDALASRRPWPVALVGALVLVAACARASAEHFSQHYFEALAIASSLWLAGALVWGGYLLRLIIGSPRTTTGAAA